MQAILLTLLLSKFPMPNIEDQQTLKAMSDTRTYWYNDSTMPPAYQKSGNNISSAHVHSPFYNISADQNEPFGNGNREFPWKTTAGTDGIAGTSSDKFVWLPPGKKIVVYQERVAKTTPPGYWNQWRWAFPVGAIVGEVLLYKGRVYEVRTRTRESDDWAVDVFRPQSLVDAADSMRWRMQRSRPTAAFRKTLEGKEYLLEGQRVDAESTFVSVAGTESSFTTQRTDGLIPPGYFAAIAGTDRDSCRNCHDQVGQDVSTLQPRRDWYGAIRGSDGIFSFHIFDSSSISTNGFDGPVRFNQRIAHMWEMYDERRHQDYSRLPKFSGGSLVSFQRSDGRTALARTGGNVCSDCGPSVGPVNPPPDPYPTPRPTPEIDYDRIVRDVLDGIRSNYELQELLRGPTGKTGSRGADGRDGMDGQPGPPGVRGPAGPPASLDDLPLMGLELYSPEGKLLNRDEQPLGGTFRLQFKTLQPAERTK